MIQLDSLAFIGGRVVRFAEHHLTSRYVAWLNDSETVRYSEQRHRLHTLESCRAYFESFLGGNDVFLAIESDAQGHVGNIGVSIDVANGIADVSIIVGEASVRGTGLASEAWRAVVDALIGSGRVRKVTAGTMAVNQPMLRLMARSGMPVEAVRRRHVLWEGHEVDMVYAARFARSAATLPDEGAQTIGLG